MDSISDQLFLIGILSVWPAYTFLSGKLFSCIMLFSLHKHFCQSELYLPDVVEIGNLEQRVAWFDLICRMLLREPLRLQVGVI